jgi:hypothetical protein
MSKFDGKKNADRISSSIVAMFSLKEKVNRMVAEAEEQDGFFNRPLYDENYIAEDEQQYVDKY